MPRLPINLLWVLFAGFILSASAVLSAHKPPAPNGFLLVANQGDRSLSIIDPGLGQQVAAVPEGGITGHEVAASPDGRLAYVPIYGSSGVGKPGTDGRNLVVIDIAARKVIGDIDFGHGVRPHCAVFGPKTGLLYVTTELDNSVSIIDPRSLRIVGSIPTGQAQSHMFALTRDERRGYTSNVRPGSVSVLDLKTRRTIAIIPISDFAQRISLSADDAMVFTADQIKPELVVIDTATNKVRTRVELPGTGYGSAPTADGRWLIIAVPAVNKVAVIDLRTMKVTQTIDVPAAPQEVLVRPDNQVAYVSCNRSGQIAVINLATWNVDKLIDAGKGADGLGWAMVR